MRIEFGLPTGAGGMAAAHSAAMLRSRLRKWQDQYCVELVINNTSHDHRPWLEVEFTEEQHYTLFILTWETGSEFMPWKKVLQP